MTLAAGSALKFRKASPTKGWQKPPEKSLEDMPMSRLSTVHILGLRLNQHSWTSLKSGLMYTSVLKVLKMNMV